jgi:hypothetical protein
MKMAAIGSALLDKILSTLGKNEEAIRSRNVYRKNQFTQPCLIERAMDAQGVFLQFLLHPECERLDGPRKRKASLAATRE